MAKWIGFNIPVDGEYEFRVITSDEAGNKGVSELSEKITVDTAKPITNIVKLDEFTDAEQIEINLNHLGDTVNVTLYYYFARENEEVMPIVWDKYGDYLISEMPISISIENQFHYYFRITAYDLAGNTFHDSYEDIIVDRDKPQKIRNLEITETNQIVNGTTDVLISFKSSQSKDLIGYNIYRSTIENETGNLIGYIEAGDLYVSFRDSKVDMGYKYYYSVMAIDRMNFESDAEIGTIVLEIEEVTMEETDDEGMPLLFIGAGAIGLIGIAGAGYYFTGNKDSEEIIAGIAEVVNEGETNSSNFTEMDGEFLCGACGSMFEMNEERTCPSCGTMDE